MMRRVSVLKESIGEINVCAQNICEQFYMGFIVEGLEFI